ncbi:hypothetical protein G9A89_020759 [Geosiphon pyriformis]|nr:hypothetical protein G9A89_020759 [Geosiphon pyriformis]
MNPVIGVNLTNHPDLPNSLQWSEDNQIAVVTPSALYIFSPKYKGAYPLGLSRLHMTILSLENVAVKSPFPKYSNDFATQSTFFSAEGFRCLTWSPIGCSNYKGCLLAAITTHFYVGIYGPKSGSNKDEWVETVNLSQLLMESLTTSKYQSSIPKILTDEMSSMSISWSPQCFSVYHSFFSLIALGSKAGIITLWSYTKTTDHINTFKAHDSWVVVIAWSRWEQDSDNTCLSKLITGCVDGSISLWNIKLALSNNSTGLQLPEVTVELQQILTKKDYVVPSVAKWFFTMGHGSDQVAVAKGTKIYIWNISSSLVQIIAEPVELNNFFFSPMSITGLSWNHNGSQLRVFTVDGKHTAFDIVNNTIHMNDYFTEFMSEKVDEICFEQLMNLDDDEIELGLEEEEEDDDDDDENNEDIVNSRTLFYGADGSANGLYISMIFGMLSQIDMEYVTDKADNAYLCLFLIEEEDLAQFKVTLITRLKEILDNPYLLLEKTPGYLLWDLMEFFDIQDDKIVTLFPDLLKACKDFYQVYPSKLTNLQDLGELNQNHNDMLLNRISRLWKEVFLQDCSLNALRLASFLYSKKMVENFLSSSNLPATVYSEIEVHAEIEKHRLNLILTIIHNYLNQGLQITNAIDQLFVLNVCDRTLVYFGGDLNILKLANIGYEYMSNISQTHTWDVQREMNFIRRILVTRQNPNKDKWKEPIREPYISSLSVLVIVSTCLKGHWIARYLCKSTHLGYLLVNFKPIIHPKCEIVHRLASRSIG